MPTRQEKIANVQARLTVLTNAADPALSALLAETNWPAKDDASLANTLAIIQEKIATLNTQGVQEEADIEEGRQWRLAALAMQQLEIEREQGRRT